ncbi:unnamed protein product [Didymodactylos carnosus]|uniref:peptide chain release factor N(5)-glutamine methyltransferase n=1 Tax=Didymodactylos carnosus TaxID=1234261 RepID=A0A814CR37_9BILA|nr:unnamed protein product [Didymodactylos carnosus]CAF1381674.1 unnamed protein product [Didymodactylos carnosus]CAF3721873.1 unnamed protein product [Didymodactylos carnosus]CAF4190122.1 unnamed protein product [Didymodactylos carnosus]
MRSVSYLQRYALIAKSKNLSVSLSSHKYPPIEYRWFYSHSQRLSHSINTILNSLTLSSRDIRSSLYHFHLKTSINLFSHRSHAISSTRLFKYFLKQWLNHVPYQYIFGTCEFYRRLFQVNRHVLIPRPDTECLINRVQELYPKHEDRSLRVLDIGTGSGCIPIILQLFYPQWSISACDISSKAIKIARLNSRLNCTPRQIQFRQADLFQDNFYPLKQFDLVVSNPPYITPSELSVCDKSLHYEPRQALFVKDKQDPFGFYREIMNKCSNYLLKPDGYLIMECSQFNVKGIYELFKLFQFKNVQVDYDWQYLPRVIYGQK